MANFLREPAQQARSATLPPAAAARPRKKPPSLPRNAGFMNPFEIREASQTCRTAQRCKAGLNPFEIREASQTPGARPPVDPAPSQSLRNQGSQSDDVSRSDPAVIGLNPFEIREAGQTWTGRRHTLRRSLNPFEIREAGQTRRRAGRAGAALGLNPFEIREAGQTLFNSGMGKSRVSQSLRNQGSRSD